MDDLPYVLLCLVVVFSGYGGVILDAGLKEKNIWSDSETFEGDMKNEILSAGEHLFKRVVDTFVSFLTVPVICVFGPLRVPGIYRKLSAVGADEYYAPIFLEGLKETILDLPFFIMLLFLLLSIYGALRLRRKMNDKQITLASPTFSEDFK